MQFFAFLATFLLLLRIRKGLRFSIFYPKWKTMLHLAILVCVVLFFVSESLFHDTLNVFLGSFVLLGLLQYIKKEPDFKPQTPFINAHYPLVGVGILMGLTKVVASDFYHQYGDYFQLVYFGCFIWIFARMATSKKQEEELRIIGQRKTELEMLVAERTMEITRQKDELQDTVKELQATQAQLIQQEKLASLGELTAGIAHEIQNPLNFVNNFAEVSAELIDEMAEEIAKGDTEEVLAIAADIKQNLEKIRHHGQRADGIVKGMLQHSRASNDAKEPTDINNLASEYLRLAYHGLRAKDKSFNAELVTNFQDNMPKVEVFAQDIGRVMLNLFTNAFYAVQQKQKRGIPDYKPTVTITTATKGKLLEIKVRDNGIGIPESIKDKIMQPFFTTKPTGEGTGLGLSLSFDIVVKAHGGKIDIQTQEGEFTEFTLSVPV